MSPTRPRSLYHHAGVEAAVWQFERFPPEEVHRAANLHRRSQEWIDENVDGWRFDIEDPSGRVEWQGICLDGAHDGDPRCVSYWGWAQFCEWTFETRLTRLGWTMDDPEVVEFLVAVGDLTADRLSCA